jgi:hypothetical protein
MSDKPQCAIDDDGTSQFVVFDGDRIAKRREPNTPSPYLGGARLPRHRTDGRFATGDREGKPLAAIMLFRPKR